MKKPYWADPHTTLLLERSPDEDSVAGYGTDIKHALVDAALGVEAP